MLSVTLSVADCYRHGVILTIVHFQGRGACDGLLLPRRVGETSHGGNPGQAAEVQDRKSHAKPTSEYTFSVETQERGLPVALRASYGRLAMSSGGNETAPSAMEATRPDVVTLRPLR